MASSYGEFSSHLSPTSSTSLSTVGSSDELHDISAEEQRRMWVEEGKKEQKRRAKPRDGTQLYCKVCGDKALGYNFDAITCESCKAFFRRNANKPKTTFSCNFSGSCKLDPHSRKFCSACRLRKCFAVGMKKDWILSSEKLEKRRSRLRMRSDTDRCSMMEPGSSGEVTSTLSSPSDMPLPRNNPPPGTSEPPQAKTPPVEEEDYKIPVSEEIHSKLMMMHKTYNDIFEATYSLEQSKKLQVNPSNCNDLFNMTDIFIRRLIKFAKCIPQFKALTQDDQIHLLKGGIMEIFVLRSAMGFDHQKGTWNYRAQQQEGEVKEGKLDPNSLKNTLGTCMYHNHIEFVTSIQRLTQGDRIVLMLLFVINLMSADRPNLQDKLLVSQAQDQFSMWLKAYLESTLTVGKAKVLYPKLLMKLWDVRSLGEASSTLAMSLDISRLEPLLVEVFDLRP